MNLTLCIKICLLYYNFLNLRFFFIIDLWTLICNLNWKLILILRFDSIGKQLLLVFLLIMIFKLLKSLLILILIGALLKIQFMRNLTYIIWNFIKKIFIFLNILTIFDKNFLLLILNLCIWLNIFFSLIYLKVIFGQIKNFLRIYLIFNKLLNGILNI